MKLRLSASVFVASLIAAMGIQPVLADFTGKVVGITDGDTITVLRDREQVKVRLTEIDAPEKAQPFGNSSKQALSELVYGQEVRVVEKGQDFRKRTLGMVYRGDLDVNAEMVRLGMAWVYRKYASKKSPLLDIEREVKKERRGLWADNEPVPPWVWRKTKASMWNNK